MNRYYRLMICIIAILFSTCVVSAEKWEDMSPKKWTVSDLDKQDIAYPTDAHFYYENISAKPFSVRYVFPKGIEGELTVNDQSSIDGDFFARECKAHLYLNGEQVRGKEFKVMVKKGDVVYLAHECRGGNRMRGFYKGLYKVN